MTLKNISLSKYKIIVIALLVVSVTLNILQRPVYDHLFLLGQDMRNPIKTFTFTFFLFVLEAILISAYILFQKNKILSKFFSVALIVNIVSRIYSIINLIKLIGAYSQYNAGMEWVKPIIRQYTTNVLIATVYLFAFLFLLIDSLSRHKHLKISRIIMLVIATINLFTVIMNFVNHNALYAFVLNYGFFFTLALLIYYFFLAKNKSKISLENELYRLKAEYENGNITIEEYTISKQNILSNL